MMSNLARMIASFMICTAVVLTLLHPVDTFQCSIFGSPQMRLRSDTSLKKIFDWRKRELYKEYLEKSGDLPHDYPIREDTLIPIPGSRKPFNRVGRGISAGQGASCGRGTRGTQKSRGHGVRPGFEGGQTPLHLRLPKYRKMKGHRKKKYNLIHMAMLNALPGDMDVCYETLFDLGLCTKVKRKNRIFKVLGGENCTAANLTVKAHAFTRTAKQAIEAVGGQCVVLSKTRHIPEHIALKEKKERIAANLVKLKALRQLKLRTKREKQAALEASPDYVPPKPKVKKKPKPKAKKKKKKAPAKVITSKNKKKEDKGGKKKKKK